MIEVDLRRSSFLTKNKNKNLPSPKLTEELNVLGWVYLADAASLKTLLGHLTGRSTFPNVLVSFESIGGGDDVEILYSEGGLVKLLRKAGIRVRT